MTAAPSYTIANPLDFLAVPADRRQTCLAEFAGWLAMADVVARIPGGGTFSPTFVWVDDGKGELTVNARDLKGNILESVVMPLGLAA